MRQESISRDSALEVLQMLISTPSVNPSLAPDEGHGEASIAGLARDWLTARGLRSWLEEAAPSRPNVLAEAGHGQGPTLVLCAHLDTVGTAGMTIPPFEPVVESSRVYGRGSYDMKGSAAAVMTAAAALSAKGLSGRVLIALVADEEYASIGAQDFVRRHPADACILTEPSEGRLILAHKGFVWAEIVTTGSRRSRQPLGPRRERHWQNGADRRRAGGVRSTRIASSHPSFGGPCLAALRAYPGGQRSFHLFRKMRAPGGAENITR